MSGRTYERRNYSYTSSYYRYEDASLLASDFNSSLRFSHSEESMDVDCEENSDIDDEELIPYNEDEIMKRKHLHKNFHQSNYSPQKIKTLEYVTKKESHKSYSTCLPGVLLIVLGVFCYYFLYYDSDVNTRMLQNITEELQSRVLFQDESVQLILKNFQCVNTSDDCRMILPFVGSTGVGKTFIANIIKKHFAGKHVGEINMIKLNTMHERDNIIKAINKHVCNLIIIDDLRFEHINSVLNFVNTLPEIRCLYIIPIFNIQETSDNIAHVIRYEDIENIPREFKGSNLKCDAILFNSVDEEMVKKWLERLLMSRNVVKENWFVIISDVLKHHDVKHHGFKGIEAKVNLLLHGNSEG